MRLIVFGTGIYWDNRKKWIKPEDEVVAFFDNDQTKHGRSFNGAKIYPPQAVLEMTFDAVLLMSDYAPEMREQLISLSVPNDKIWFWGKYKQITYDKVIERIGSSNRSYGNNVLIITTDMNYNGGSMAALYLAEALDSCGYTPDIATPSWTRPLRRGGEGALTEWEVE